MIQCPECGVELEENANFCSLCGIPLADKSSEEPAYVRSGKARKEEKLLTDYRKLTGFQKRKIFWKISGVILISGIVSTLLIDFFVNQGITWSRFPATVGLVLYINFTLNTFLRKKIILMLLLSFVSVSGLFLLFDFYAGGTGGRVKLGIPVLVAGYIVVLTLVFVIRNSRQKGLNVIAYSLLAAGLLCGCVDALITIYNRNRLRIDWSLVVMVSVLFVSLLLLYIHYQLRKATDLKRFFHI
ncbi:MAG: DUF6320 domain-containing protein [Prolixibacteraceae bacterium]